MERFSELVHLRRLLEILNINCVLDVGANRGQYARELREIGYRGHIISFEPIEGEFRTLCEAFKNDTKWEGYQCALGCENGSKPFHVNTRLSVLSSFLPRINEEHDVAVQEVEIRRLDSLFPALVEKIPNPRVFLKMDTQGYDLEVLAGAEAVINAIFGLQSELSVRPLYRNMPCYLDALTSYGDYGFELYNLSVVNRVVSGDLLEMNCFMKRSSSSISGPLDAIKTEHEVPCRRVGQKT